jgi:hypothetical protein
MKWLEDVMDFSFIETDNNDFDAQTYVRMLIAIAKSDPENGPPEFAYVRRLASRLGIDFDQFMKTTDKSFSIDRHSISRLTALVIIKDAIMLASLDRNFSLPERQRVYSYAEKLDIPRKDVDVLETLIAEYRQLHKKWQQLVVS